MTAYADKIKRAPREIAALRGQKEYTVCTPTLCTSYHKNVLKENPEQIILFPDLPEVPAPGTDWLEDSAFAILSYVQSRLPSAPTEPERQLLDEAAEAFFLRIGV